VKESRHEVDNGEKAKSHVTFTNIIDVPSADDPSCVTTIYL